MTETLAVAIVAAAGTAIPIMFASYLGFRRTSEKLDRMHTSLQKVNQDVITIEMATNSMKDALIAAAYKAGIADEKEIQRLVNIAAADDIIRRNQPPLQSQ